MELTLTIQGWFYVTTGIWPIMHMSSFEMVTGPKVDKWLVKTVGLMILCSGIIFIKYSDSEVALYLAFLNAISLASIDIYFSMKKIISKIYLADAFVELGLVGIYIYLGM